MICNMIVACYNAGGEPDLFFVKVECTEEQYENGEHYGAAERAAWDEGYESDQMVSFDQNDSAGRAMQGLFAWESASITKV